MKAARPLVVLLVVPLLAVPAAALHTGPEPGVLYLAADPEGGRDHNFTTHAPEDPGRGAALPMLTSLNRSQIEWSMASVPAHWNVTAGTEARLDVWIRGLDRVVAVADPGSALAEPDKVVVEASLRHGDDVTPFGHGETRVAISPAAPDDTPREITVALTLSRTAAFTNDTARGASLILELVVRGHNRPERPLEVHVASPETPSRLFIATFPVEAFRAWEDAERQAAECQARLLEDLPCQEDPTPTGDDPADPATTPLPWFAGLAAILGVALWVLARRR